MPSPISNDPDAEKEVVVPAMQSTDLPAPDSATLAPPVAFGAAQDGMKTPTPEEEAAK